MSQRAAAKARADEVRRAKARAEFYGAKTQEGADAAVLSAFGEGAGAVENDPTAIQQAAEKDAQERPKPAKATVTETKRTFERRFGPQQGSET